MTQRFAPRPRRIDLRATALLAACGLALLALVAPSVPATGPSYHLLAVVDVTGSMTVRDMTVRDVDGRRMGSDQRPTSRLDAVKQRLRNLLAQLPCGSRLGLGIFTERRSFLLFEPVETCANFAPLDGAIAALDWRMAWEGDSYVARGLYSALSLAAPLDADLLFLSDGQEAPPLPPSGLPPFEGKTGATAGAIIGVGGAVPVPIPKFDGFGHEIGFLQATDVPQENRHGPPPEDASQRPGWHPRNAPWGGDAAAGEEHLSALRTAHLQALATTTSLGYATLAETEDLLPTVAARARPRPVPQPFRTAPLFAALALTALTAALGASFAPRLLSAKHTRTLPNAPQPSET
ncbi:MULTISPECIES: VWA domain-containing protein [unclassified Xanthobacter]|uniref:VWA domain-containing protein n=1 Tax=unclassified Xanthobacter TaxID=2623496 RepID=UPI001EDE917E|nr:MULTISPECIES: VWA domain-containing protein [unclassified Xanthobacter]